MGKKALLSCSVGVILIVLVIALSGYSQEEVTRVEDSAFKNRMRPSVAFLHDKHNDKAKIEECQICHHVYKQGKKVKDSSSEDSKCSECHKIQNDDPMPLVKAYHSRCKGCHVEKKVGPVMCAECHLNETHP